MRSVFIFAAILSLGFSAPGALGAPEEATPSEEPSAAALEHLRRGTREYKAENWGAAREAFLSAWELQQHYAIAISLAEAEMKVGRYLDAADHLQYYLAHLPTELEAKRADGEAKLAECIRHLGRVRVTVNVAGAALSVGPRILGPAPLNDVVLFEPGVYYLHVARDGYEPADRQFTARSGENTDVDVVLEARTKPDLAFRTAPTPVTASSSPAHTDTSSGVSPRTVVLLGGATLTLLGATLGVVYYAKSSSLSDEVEALQAQTAIGADPTLVSQNRQCAAAAIPRPGACDALPSKVHEYDQARNTAVVSFVAAGIVGAATAAAFVLWPTPGETRQPAAAPRLTPWVIGQTRGLSMRLRF